MKNKIKIDIVKQIDGYYKVKVKGVGETYTNSLEDVGAALEEIIQLNKVYAD